MKTCSKCGERKELVEYYKNRARKDGRGHRCKACKKEYGRKWYEENKEAISEQKRKYYEENKEAISEQKRKYYEENKEAKNEYQRKYIKYRIHTDPLYKFICTVRVRTKKAFIRNGYTKNSRTHELIGCSFEELASHLQETVEESYGVSYDYLIKEGVELHIDHVYPISKAQTEDEVIELSHYSNLQYLIAEDNLEKNNNINWTIF